MPILQLSFMYLPLTLYLTQWFKDSGTRDRSINPLYFLLCAVVDVHATLFIVMAYSYTSITSVMLLTDFTIPCAVILSLTFLKLRFRYTHYIAICICLCGTGCSLYNDLYYKNLGKEGTDQTVPRSELIGDLLTLLGSCFYALSNILQEKFLKKQRDIYHYLGFLGLFGFFITIIEATLFDDFTKMKVAMKGVKDWYIVSQLVAFVAVNFIGYSVIPIFV